MQHRDPALESGLDRGGARRGEGDPSELAAGRFILVGAGSEGGGQQEARGDGESEAFDAHVETLW